MDKLYTLYNSFLKAILCCGLLLFTQSVYGQTVGTPSDANTAANTMNAYSAVGTSLGITATATITNGANIALNKTATVSSLENGAQFPASGAVDGNLTTRWSSAYADPQWIYVDLGGTYTISQIMLYWEAAYAKAYSLQISSDANTWNNMYSTTTENGGTDNITGLSGTGRYVRMYGTVRGSGYGYSLWEFQIYGTAPTTYSLSTNPSNYFAINSSTGVVTANFASIPAGTYTIGVTATSGAVTSSPASFTVTVYPSAPTVTGGSTCGTGPVTLTAAGTPSGGTYNWYTASTGGTLLQSSTSNTYTPTISATTNYYVSYTSGGQTSLTRSQVTATYNSVPSASFSATTPPNSMGSSTINYTGTDPATSTYNWTFTNGTPSTGTGQGPFTVTWSGSGTPSITLTVTNAGGCQATSTQTIATGAYAYSLPITLNTTGLGISTDLTNFPFLVSITDPSLIVSSTSCSNKIQFPNGPDYDFTFFDNTINSETSFDVESYNPATGTLLVWVKLAKLSHTTNNTLTFYYGSITAPGHTTAFHQATWSGDYLSVYHFNEASFTGSVTDATSNGRTGTTNNMVSTDLVSTGKINSAYSFNKSSSKSITVSAGASVTGPFTLSAWINLGATGNDQKVMTNQGAGGSGSGGYKLGVYTNNIAESESPGVNRGFSPVAPAMAASTWHYIQTVYNGATEYTYVDGVQYQAFSTTTNPSSTNPLYIGAGEGGNSYYFTGTIDEARVSNVAKTSDWLLAEYKNQNTPASYTSTTGVVTTNLLNAEQIYGGVTFSTSDAANYTYSSNGSNISATPQNGGKENFIVTGSATLGVAANVYGITINPSQAVNLNGQTLSVGCNIVNNGTISYSSNNASTVVFNGSMSAQSYTGTATNAGQAANLTINNSVGGTITITGGNFSVYNTLNITSGNLVINNSATGSLTLKSLPALTASVTAIPSGYSVSGNVNVERYFKAGTATTTRNYRSLSSAVNNGAGGYNLAYLSNASGVFTAGPGGIASGFTVTNATPTVDIYQENTTSSNASFNAGNFKGLTNITGNTLSYYANGTGTVAATTLPVGNGFLLYYCGNNIGNTNNKQFKVAGVYMDPDASTTTQTGILNQGSITVKPWFNGGAATLTKVNTGYTLVGNPYASSIDWDTYSASVTTAGIYAPKVSSTIYIFNYSSKNYGYYQAGTSGGKGTNNATHVIASGQGFYVYATSASGASLTFNEAAKTSVQPNNAGSGNASYLLLNSAPQQKAATPQLLRVKLAKDTINTDDIMLLFEPSASNKFEQYVDVERIDGMSNVSTLGSYSSDSLHMLGINHLHSIDSTTRIKLYVNVSSSNGTDTLSGSGFESLDNRYTVWLLDHYKKDSLQFSLYKKYLFNISNSDTASYGANRFEIVFRKQGALIYRLLSFTGTPAKGTIQLNWTTSGEGDSSRFELQRLNSSGQFITVNQQQANGSGAYNYLDTAPLAGNNSYRLQQTDSYGVVTYSNVITISSSTTKGGDTQPVISLFPNPVVSQFTITINQNAPANVILKVTDALGQVVISKQMPGTNIQQSVSGLLPGSYVVQIIDKATQNAVGMVKFVKK